MNKVYGLRLVPSIEAAACQKKAVYRGVLCNWILSFGSEYLLECHLRRFKRYYV